MLVLWVKGAERGGVLARPFVASGGSYGERSELKREKRAEAHGCKRWCTCNYGLDKLKTTHNVVMILQTKQYTEHNLKTVLWANKMLGVGTADRDARVGYGGGVQGLSQRI